MYASELLILIYNNSQEKLNMEKIDIFKKEYCTEILKDAHETDRIYFTSGDGKEFVLISR